MFVVRENELNFCAVNAISYAKQSVAWVKQKRIDICEECDRKIMLKNNSLFLSRLLWLREISESNWPNWKQNRFEIKLFRYNEWQYEWIIILVR